MCEIFLSCVNQKVQQLVYTKQLAGVSSKATFALLFVVITTLLHYGLVLCFVFAIGLALAASLASYQGSLPSGVYFSCTKPGKNDEPCSEGHDVQASF